MTPRTVACRGECGIVLADELEAERTGWSFLPISRAWRCGACSRALLAASTFGDSDPGEFVDTLPADSRGALKKETASGITPPTVNPRGHQ